MTRSTASDITKAAPARIDPVFGTRMDRLRLRHLRLFDMLASAGSLTAAAARIGMSQPAATKMLQELEDAFGCSLVQRSAKGGQLNAAGLHVLNRMRIALGSLGSARAAVEASRELPLVRLGMLPLVGIEALCSIVGRMEAEQSLPRIQIRLGTVEGLLKALADGLVDCVVGGLDDATVPDSIDKFHVTPLWEERLVVVAAADHPWSRRRKVPLDLAREADWVLMLPGSANRRAVERLFLQAGMAPPVARIETESFHIGLSLVAGSSMLAAVPESAYRQYRPRVKALRMERVFPSKALVFVTLADLPRLPAVDSIAQRFAHYTRTLESARPIDRRSR